MGNNSDAAALTEDSIQKLKASISSEFISANSVALAVLGWITGITLTEPCIDELLAASDESVTIRYADEATAHRLCSLHEFLMQVRQLCGELGLSDEEAQSVVIQVEGRLHLDRGENMAYEYEVQTAGGSTFDNLERLGDRLQEVLNGEEAAYRISTGW